MMDRNELVEKAVLAMYEGRPLDLDQEDDEWETLPDDWKEEWRDGARAALDAILPDVIEVVQAEAAQIAELKAIQLNNSGISLPESEWVRAACESKGATGAAAAIRAAVLGDALKGGK